MKSWKSEVPEQTDESFCDIAAEFLAHANVSEVSRDPTNVPFSVRTALGALLQESSCEQIQIGEYIFGRSFVERALKASNAEL